MDSEIYFLKNNFYKDQTLEKKLCNLLKQYEWNVFPTFFECVKGLQENRNEKGVSYPLLCDEFYEFLTEHTENIERIIEKIERDSIPFEMTYFGLQTLKSKYLIHTHDGIHENIDHLWLRIALFIYRENWEMVEKMILDLRQGCYVHATPTLFNAGLRHHQMASCFLKGTRVLTEDGYESIEKIKIGTKVWTHEKKWKPVVQCHTNDLGERQVFRIRCGSSIPIYVTENHPFRVYNPKKGFEEWVDIKDCDLNTLFINPYQQPQVGMEKMFVHAFEYDGIHHIFNDNYEILIENTKADLFCDVMENTKTFQITNSYKLKSHHVFSLARTFETESPTKDIFSVMEYDPISFYRFVRGLQMVYGFRKKRNNITIRLNDYPKFSKLAKMYKLKVNDVCMYRDNRIEIEILNPSKLQTVYEPYVKLKSKIRIPCLPQKVYTLGVTDHHSYTVDGEFVVKNCFLLGTEDSIRGIYKTLGDCAMISKFSGGVGLHCHSIRSNGSYIHGTNGKSNGIVPMLKVFNDTARYVDQGGGKRNGSFAIYIEPWHADVKDFLMLKRNIGSDDVRARDLFYALWIPDYFMECVEKNTDWFLFDPSTAKRLHTTYGMDFKELYQYYVDKKLYVDKVNAQTLWKEILRIQIETGTPYILYKDRCNENSNQKNVGTIQSSNLCCEIIQYSSEKEYAVCNLASISLPYYLQPNANRKTIETISVVTKPDCSFCLLAKYFLKQNNIVFDEIDFKKAELLKVSFPQIYVNNKFIGGFVELWELYLCPEFNFQLLSEKVQMIVNNLNNIIDKNKYPLPECEYSNKRHRPIGIGVQGLADCFMKMLYPYDSEKARQLNRKIFETIYFHALQASNILAKRHGPYDSYDGSPISKGIFHFEMGKNPYSYPLHYEWEALRASIMEHGTYNSLLVALMPTASTSQLLGNTESFEPLTSNIYVRRTNVGEYIVVNRILQNILKGMGLWNENMYEKFVLEKGSIQNIKSIPSFLKNIFRTVWQIPQKHIIEMAADRQYFIDQSQSMNIFLTNPTIELLTKVHFYGWRKGLKTGSYYIRTRSLTDSQNFFLDANREKMLQECDHCSS